MNPFAFIVGCPRSGTTLLQRILDAHPQVAFINETRWIADFYKLRKGLTPDRRVTPELILRLLEHDRFSEMKIGREALEELMRSHEGAPYASFVTALFDLYGQAQQKPLVGDKTPGYCRKFRTLHRLWPTARFVHLIRDGRDTGLSILNWRTAERALGRHPTWADDRVVTTALWWEWHVRMGREGGRSLGPDLYYEIRYEALVARPEEECVKLCAFLGVPSDPAMLRFYEGRTRTDPGLDAKTGWWPVTSGLRDWRRDMAPEEVERFEAAAGDLLEELGDPRAVRCPGGEAAQHVARVRGDFVRDLQARGSRVPEHWQREAALAAEAPG